MAPKSSRKEAAPPKRGIMYRQGFVSNAENYMFSSLENNQVGFRWSLTWPNFHQLRERCLVILFSNLGVGTTSTLHVCQRCFCPDLCRPLCFSKEET